jgi:hypothetical protein
MAGAHLLNAQTQRPGARDATIVTVTLAGFAAWLGDWLLISILGRAEDPADQANHSDDTADNLNEELGVGVTDEP